MEITGIIAILLFVIIAAVLLYFSFRTWPIYMVILVFFVMLASGTAMVLAALSRLGTHGVLLNGNWQTTVEKREKELDTVRDGDENAAAEEIDPETGKQRETAAKFGIDDLQSNLNEVQAGRGRVWGLAGPLWKMDEPGGISIVGSFDGQSKLDLTFTPKEPPADPQMTSGMLLYAFAVTQKISRAQKSRLRLSIWGISESLAKTH